jgi:predicted transcriptional regulator
MLLKKKPKDRKCSKDTLMMLTIMHNEGVKLSLIAELLGRTPAGVEKAIKDLFSTGMAEKIHKDLIAHDGLYARNMAGKPFPVCRFKEEK